MAFFPAAGLLSAVAVASLAACGSPEAPASEPQQLPSPSFRATSPNPKAPPETAQFGRLVGSWDIADETLGTDGEWTQGQGAEWHWYYALDGWAIQDDWIAPALSVEVPDSAQRQFGTNLRIYNPKEARWELAWTNNLGPTIAEFTAHAVDSSLVMESKGSGPVSRITFFAMTDSTFEWKMERQLSDTNWTEVYRIHGRRRP